jgi:uncharacterized phiE125 gp8 family phage protein
MLLLLNNPPNTEAGDVVTLAEVKAMLKFDDGLTSEDDLLDVFRLAAIAAAENFLNRKLLTQTWSLTLDGFTCNPYCQEIWLPYGSTQSISEIRYIDQSNVEQVWDSSLYRLDGVYSQGRITPAYGEVFPATPSVKGSVTITFVCGYGDTSSSIPDEIRLAILFAVRNWYDNRSSGDIPQAAQLLLWPHRILEV